MKIRALITVILMLSVCVIFICFYKIPKNNPTLTYLNECLDDRVCLEQENSLLIGNNEKELQNNYYDLTISNNENGVTFVINKLWYKEFNESLYEKEYVENICKYISKMILKRLNVNIDNNKLYQNIISGYSKAKDNAEYNVNLIMNNVNFNIYTQNFELVLKVGVM